MEKVRITQRGYDFKMFVGGKLIDVSGLKNISIDMYPGYSEVTLRFGAKTDIDIVSDNVKVIKKKKKNADAD